MKTKYLVMNVFQWIAALMKINCVPMNTAGSSSQQIDEDRLEAEAVLQHLCKGWSPFLLRGPYKHLASECTGRCGKGKAFLLPNRKTLICYTNEESARVYSVKRALRKDFVDISHSVCECGMVLYGSYDEGSKKKTCDNIPYRIKSKMNGDLSCNFICSNVTIFTTNFRPYTRLEWCDESKKIAAYNKVKLKGIVKGRFKEREKKEYKCWCGLATEDIQPSIVPMPIAEMAYWLNEGLKPSRELKELNLISNISSDNFKKQETSLGEMCSYNIESSTRDMVGQASSKKINSDTSLKYYNFLHPSSQSCDNNHIVKNHDEDMAVKNSMKSREEITNISKEEFQLIIKSSNQEIAPNKQENEFVRTSTPDEQLSFGTRNHYKRYNKPENKVLSMLEENLQLSLGLSTSKSTCSKPRSQTHKKLTQDQQFGFRSSNKEMDRMIPEAEALAALGNDLKVGLNSSTYSKPRCKNSETLTTLGCDLHLGLGSSSQEISHDNNYEQRVNLSSISNCHDFLYLKPSLQDNIEKNVISVDSNRKKIDHNHDGNEHLSQYEYKKRRLHSPGSFMKSKGNLTHSLLSMVKPIPIIGIGKDDEGLRFNLKSNLGGNKEIRGESEKRSAFTVPVELRSIQKDIGNLKIKATIDKKK